MTDILKFSQAGGNGTITRYANFLTNYGDFGAMQRIAYGSLSGLPTTILSGIPQNYQDLYLVISASNSSSNFLSYLYFGSNNGLHSGTVLYGNGTSALSTRYTNDNSVLADWPTSLGMVNSTTIRATYQFHIMNYANTSTNKTILSRVAADQNGSGYTSLGAHTLRNTAAINGVYLSAGGGAFSSGSTFTLYGIKASAA